jgi:hypothetical protein
MTNASTGGVLEATFPFDLQNYKKYWDYTNFWQKVYKKSAFFLEKEVFRYFFTYFLGHLSFFL